MKIPKINIIYDIDKEMEAFLKFLNDPNRLQRRNAIFKEHPKIKIAIEEAQAGTPELQRKIVRKYLEEFQENNKDKITKIINDARNVFLTQTDSLLYELARLMDYKWKDDDSDFTAIPTCLPFCPFEKNTFYFTIRTYLKGERDINDILFTAAHEISHFLLFKILWGNKMNPDDDLTLQVLQEVLAPVIMNQPELVQIIKHDANNYFGNPDIALLYVNTNKNNSQRISVSFKTAYDLLRQKGANFIEILHLFIEILTELKNDLIKKRDFWNINGHKIPQDKKLYEIYTEPMEIKNSRKELFSSAITS
jgi:hypothetical protein